MKKSLLIWVVLFFAAFQAYAQAYVKFEETPAMKLKVASEYYNYKISYNSPRKSTIYLELKKGNKIVASGIYDVSKSEAKVVSISIKTFDEIGSLTPGSDYSYNLYMYEGGRNDWSVKACDTFTVKGVVVGNPNKSSNKK